MARPLDRTYAQREEERTMHRAPRRTAAVAVSLTILGLGLGLGLSGCADTSQPSAADVGYSQPVRRATPAALPSALDTQAADRAASAGAAAYQQKLDTAVAEAEQIAAAAAAAYFTLDGTTQASGGAIAVYEEQLERHATHGVTHASVDVLKARPGFLQSLAFERAMERGVVESVSLSDDIDANLGLLIFDVDLDQQRKTPTTNWVSVETYDLDVTVVFVDGRWRADLIRRDGN